MRIFSITKIKSWAIYFQNDNGAKFLVHVSTDCYESDITIYYRKPLDNLGKYELEHIKTKMHCGSYLNDFNMKKGETYSSITVQKFASYLINTFGVMIMQKVRDWK